MNAELRHKSENKDNLIQSGGGAAHQGVDCVHLLHGWDWIAVVKWSLWMSVLQWQSHSDSPMVTIPQWRSFSDSPILTVPKWHCDILDPVLEFWTVRATTGPPVTYVVTDCRGRSWQFDVIVLKTKPYITSCSPPSLLPLPTDIHNAPSCEKISQIISGLIVWKI